MDESGTIAIRKIWLKKIWEIAATSQCYPLNTQVKRDVIYNIRPNSRFKKDLPSPFANKEDFLTAMYETQKLYRGEENANEWKRLLQESYLEYYNEELIF